MVQDEMDEKARELRKKQVVEFRNKKRNSNIFLFFGTIFEIIETFVVILLLFIGVVFLASRILPMTSQAAQHVYPILFIVIFIGGMVLGFKIYKRAVVFVIKKFDLEDKLTDDVLSHYCSDQKDQVEKELKK